MKDINFAQNIFSFFKKRDHLGKIPDFINYARKHMGEFEPAIVVGVSEQVFDDKDTQEEIRKCIADKVGPEKVNFKKIEGVGEDVVTFSRKSNLVRGLQKNSLESNAMAFLSLLTSKGLYNQIDPTLIKLEELYTNYADEIVVTIKTDTPYTEKLEGIISSFCIKQSGAKRAIVKQVIDTKQGGGFQVRWRDFVYIGTYSNFLNKFR